MPKEAITRGIMQFMERGPKLQMNGPTIQRIVYALIKNYMITNTPAECGVRLDQTYDIDPAKSKIFIDVGYNWKIETVDKAPSIYVTRGDIDIKTPTLGQSMAFNDKNSEEIRMAICTMPIKISCIAAQPVAVVENLAEYVKQPLLSFRKEIKEDFKLRDFRLSKISSPSMLKESKTNFMVDLIIDTAFDDGWEIQKEDLKIKSIAIALFDDLIEPPCDCK